MVKIRTFPPQKWANSSLDLINFRGVAQAEGKVNLVEAVHSNLAEFPHGSLLQHLGFRAQGFKVRVEG